MTKQQRNILLKFAIWCLFGALICFIGSISVKAEEVNIGYVSDKTQVLINVPVASGGAPITLNQNTTNTAGMIIQMWVNISNITITKDYLYMLELYTPDAKLNNQINSVVVHGSSGQICQFIGLTSLTNGYPKIYFKCPANVDYISVDIKSMEQYGIVSATNFRWSYSYLRYYTEEDDIDLGPVISNQTANTNNIINNDNANTNNIINNQNENTNKEIESQKVCTETTIDKDDIKTEGKYLNSNGGENNNANFGITDYIEISKSSVIKVIKARAGSAVSYCFYDSSKTKISCDILGTNPQVGDTYTIPDNTKYVRFSINKTDNNPQYEITGACINGNQAITDAVKENEKTSKGILGKLGDLFSSFTNFVTNLFDTSGPDTSAINGMAGWLPAGPVDSIINLPLTFLNNLTTSLSTSCSALSVPLPFVNNNLTIPCFTTIISQITGANVLWTLVGTVSCCIMLYYYLKSLYKWIDKKLTLDMDDDWGAI